MSQTKAHPDHGHTHHVPAADTHAAGEGAAVDAIPAPEGSTHSRSHAAHLSSEGSQHIKPAGNVGQGAMVGELRQPPENITRSGKQHRD